jgi:hypothetical protein
MDDKIKKTLLVGFDRRPGWQGKLESLVSGLAEIIGLGLDGRERYRLAELARSVPNLIYAGLLRGIRFEFAGETCEVTLEYFPKDGGSDDLDLDVLRAVDWDVESLGVTVLVEDASYAASLGGPALSEFSSERLSIRLEGAPAGGTGDDRTGESGDGDAGESEDGGESGKGDAGESGNGDAGKPADSDASASADGTGGESGDGDSGRSGGGSGQKRRGRAKRDGCEEQGKER